MLVLSSVFGLLRWSVRLFGSPNRELEGQKGSVKKARGRSSGLLEKDKIATVDQGFTNISNDLVTINDSLFRLD